MTTEIPHRWSLEHNPLSGLTFGLWCRLLRENGFDVDSCYLHRAAFISLMSLFNSACSACERLRYGGSLRDVSVRSDPVFVLGHWRSGTTHLHNLLSLDGQLTAPNTFQAVNPSSFLSTEWILPTVFRPFLPSRRPMDEMAMSFDAPQEDELALSLLCGLSPYIGLSFPKRTVEYERFITFGGVEESVVSRWKSAFRTFTAKLSLRDQRRIVFKSPAHTGRIKLLLELFPDARFIHIHRNPFTVFQSSRHYFQTAAWFANLQKIDASQFDAAILRRYRILYDAYLEQRSLIPSGRLVELSFDDLSEKPLDSMEHLYDSLEIGDFSVVAPAVRDYLSTLSGYRKNQHRPLTQHEILHVNEHWKPFFDEFGYSTEYCA
ncbi:MAG: sulfotransferase [Planctomyces sp.]|nr:sulfotransferase [Planctomyces sp.]